MAKLKNIIPGFILTLIIATLSIYLSNFVSIGSISLAILLGFIINNCIPQEGTFFNKGISFSEKTVLSLAIIFLGSHLDVKILTALSLSKVILLILIIFISILLCYCIGKIFGLSKKISILLGVGNGICGSSAIAGASKILKADEEEIGISVAIINGIGGLSILLMPLILINFFPSFSNEQLGFIVGSTIQAFGQVTATGFIINQEVGEFATIIKMIRIVMLGPVLLILNIVFKNKNSKTKFNFFSVPLFIVGFAMFSILVSINILPNQIIYTFQILSKVLLTIAMAAIGLKISIKGIFRFGPKSFFTALLGFVIQVIFVLILVLIYF